MLMDDNFKHVVKLAAKMLTGSKRRLFEAEIAEIYFHSNPNEAERSLGWDRNTVKLGCNEKRTGFTCVSAFHLRGDKKTESKLPHLVTDIRNLVDPETQADPQMKSDFAYTRITAKKVRRELIKIGYLDKELPTERTISNILNRIGYTLKPVQKTKVEKKLQKQA